MLQQIPKLKKKETLIIPYIVNSFKSNNPTIKWFLLARVSLTNISRKNEIYADLRLSLIKKNS
jgi:hypothetical protein